MKEPRFNVARPVQESYCRCVRASYEEIDADYCRTLEMVRISSYYDAFQNGKSDIMPMIKANQNH